jgi:iron complex outermembrane receptor protein
MNDTRHKSMLLVTAALGAALAAPAIAYAAAGEEEIIVTARRVEERLKDVPISITVFNQQQLDKRNIVSATDLATYTPSLSVNTRYGTENASFSIRGFVQDQWTSPSVGVYFADVIAARGASSITSGDGAPPGSMFDLQNAQVLKGPQGTLFGRNTTGGAVLLVPKKPTSEFGGYVEASLGNYDMRRLQGVMNIPLGTKARLRMGFDRMTREGYLNNMSGIGPSHFNDVDYVAGRVGLVVDVTPDLENYTIATISHSDTNGPLGKIVGCSANHALVGAAPYSQMACAQLAREVPGGFFAVGNSVGYVGGTSAGDPVEKLDHWQVINTTTWTVNDYLTIKNIASYAQLKNKLRQDVFGTDFIVQQGSGLTTGIGQHSFLNWATNEATVPLSAQSTATDEFRLSGKGMNNRFTWQTGAYLELSDPLGTWAGNKNPGSTICVDDQALNCIGPWGAAGAVSEQLRHASFRSMGFYGQAHIDVTQKLSFDAGIRFTDDRSRLEWNTIRWRFTQTGAIVGPSCDFALNGAVLSNSCKLAVRQNSKAPTWLLGINYKLTPDTNLYAKYSRGYRQGLVNLRGVPGPYDSFGPEHLDSYEFGAKTSWGGSMPGNFDFAAFYNDISGQQVLVAWQAGSLSYAGTANAGKSRLWGVEADASISPFEGFRIDGGFAYLNTLLSKFTSPACPSALGPTCVPNPQTLQGYPLAFAPEFKETLTATYTLPMRETLGTIDIGTTFTYTDSYYTQSALAGRVGSVALLNLNLNWTGVAGSPVDFAVFATNVTDTHYYTFSQDQTASLGFVSRFEGAPQMFGARLKYRYGADARE